MNVMMRKNYDNDDDKEAPKSGTKKKIKLFFLQRAKRSCNRK